MQQRHRVVWDWLAWHLNRWREEEHAEPGHYDLFSKALSARVAWQTGVADVQQLCSAGKRESELPWASRCTVRAAVCTRARQPVAAVALAARLAKAEPDNWHGWMELGVALAELATGMSAHDHPFVIAPPR